MKWQCTPGGWWRRSDVASRNSPHFLNGAIAEVMIYDQELVGRERELVEQYLMGKYGLGVGTDEAR